MCIYACSQCLASYPIQVVLLVVPESLDTRSQHHQRLVDATYNTTTQHHQRLVDATYNTTTEHHQQLVDATYNTTTEHHQQLVDATYNTTTEHHQRLVDATYNTITEHRELTYKPSEVVLTAVSDKAAESSPSHSTHPPRAAGRRSYRSA